ncbi:MAG: hypothetical protein Ct9H90mP19_5540 [Gammaproteobacteria bacterium]|nr:MAG: hypothetical protein Ct9H90mP19_5540 [Gammaproteobacteria bacterium]
MIPRILGIIFSRLSGKFFLEIVKKRLKLGGTWGHIIQREFSESGDANIALIQL